MLADTHLLKILKVMNFTCCILKKKKSESVKYYIQKIFVDLSTKPKMHIANLKIVQQKQINDDGKFCCAIETAYKSVF